MEAHVMGDPVKHPPVQYLEKAALPRRSDDDTQPKGKPRRERFRTRPSNAIRC
jgi:hypothetical protein